MTGFLILISRINTDYFFNECVTKDLLPICDIWQRWLDLVECSGRDFEHTCMNNENQNEKHNLKKEEFTLQGVENLTVEF